MPINNITSKNHVLHIDTVLWQVRLGHDDNKKYSKFCYRIFETS